MVTSAQWREGRDGGVTASSPRQPSSARPTTRKPRVAASKIPSAGLPARVAALGQPSPRPSRWQMPMVLGAPSNRSARVGEQRSRQARVGHQQPVEPLLSQDPKGLTPPGTPASVSSAATPCSRGLPATRRPWRTRHRLGSASAHDRTRRRRRPHTHLGSERLGRPFFDPGSDDQQPGAIAGIGLASSGLVIRHQVASDCCSPRVGSRGEGDATGVPGSGSRPEVSITITLERVP